MNKPIALILAAGKSSRFEPFSIEGEHKCMTRVCGKPVIQFTVESLVKAGLKEIVIVVNEDNQIQEHFGDGSDLGAKISYAVQKKPAGMGNAILGAQKLLTREFVVLNPSQINADEHIPRLLNVMKDGALLGAETQQPWKYGNAKLDGDTIVSITEKPVKGREHSNLKLAGIWMLRKKFLEVLERTKQEEYQFESALNQYFDNHVVSFVMTKTPTHSLKYAWDLFKIMNYVLNTQSGHISRKAKIAYTATIDKNVIIEDGAHVFDHATIKGPSYIGKNTVIGTSSLIRQSSIAESVTIGAHMEIARSLMMHDSQTHSGYIGDSIVGRGAWAGAGFVTANKRLDGVTIQVEIDGKKTESNLTKLGALIGHNAKVGIKSGTMPGIVVGSNAMVGPGAMLYKNLKQNETFKTK